MPTTIDNKRTGYHLSASEIFFSFLIGLAAVGGIWLFTGLMLGLLFL